MGLYSISLLATLLAIAAAVPNGYYHQEVNYKSSSSSYKNNELQHKTDDQGFYSKQGDLEGRTKPKVTSNSEHSEYVNPKLQNQLNSGYYGAGQDSFGNANAEDLYASSASKLQNAALGSSSMYGNEDLYSGGSGYNSGSGYNTAGSAGVYSSHGSRSSSSSTSYGSSGLRSIAERLQGELQGDVQSLLSAQRARSQNINELESELKSTLSNKLQQALTREYGQQGVRGGQSYSLSDGRMESIPNYRQQELVDVQRQLENNLLQQLRRDYNYRYSHNVNSNSYHEYEYPTTAPAVVYRPIYPSIPRPEKIRYTPVPNPESITTIASKVQSDLDSTLNSVLDQTRRKYLAVNSHYTIDNINYNLDRLRDELRSNISSLLDEELRRQYGNQVQRDGYMYSLSSNGQYGTESNYNVADFQNLKNQLERNLLEKLNRDFESFIVRWRSQQQSAAYQHQSDYNYHPSSQHVYTQPSSIAVIPVISSGGHGGAYSQYGSLQSSSHQQYGGQNMAEVQRRLQHDLSRQLQAAISKNKQYSQQSGSSDGYGGYQQSFDRSYRQLYDELNRNLTRQMDEFMRGSSSSYGSLNDAQLAGMKSALERDLATQLRQGLTQSYSASASYSASSSSSSGSSSSDGSSGGSYRPVRADNYQAGYGQYNAGASIGEDCTY